VKLTTSEWVERCLDAARRAHDQAVEARGREHRPLMGGNGYADQSAIDEALDRLGGKGPGGRSPEEAATEGFLCAMPPLVDRAHTTAFIACVAIGLQHRYLTALEGKSLMYSAQLALAAHRPRQARRRPPPTPTPSGVGAKVARTVGNFTRGLIDR